MLLCILSQNHKQKNKTSTLNTILTNRKHCKGTILSDMSGFRFSSKSNPFSVCNKHHHSLAIPTSYWYNFRPNQLQSKTYRSYSSRRSYTVNNSDGLFNRAPFFISPRLNSSFASVLNVTSAISVPVFLLNKKGRKLFLITSLF